MAGSARLPALLFGCEGGGGGDGSGGGMVTSLLPRICTREEEQVVEEHVGEVASGDAAEGAVVGEVSSSSSMGDAADIVALVIVPG